MNKLFIAVGTVVLVACGGDLGTREPQAGLTSISGRIVDRVTSAPIQGVRVSTNPPTAEDVTNSEGKYLLGEQLVPNRLYTIVASANGYEQDSASASVGDKENKVVNFNLQPVLSGGLTINPTEFNFGETTESLQMRIASEVGEALDFTINQPNDSWLSIQEPYAGSLSTQSITRMLTVDRSGLAPGRHQTSFNVSSSTGSTVTVVVNVTVN